MLDTLDEMGYDVEWQVLNSKYFVPQNRERIFIIGHLRGRRGGKIFPIGQGSKLDNISQDKEQKSGEGIRSEVSSTIDSSYYKGHQGSGSYILEPKCEQVENISTYNFESSGRVYSAEKGITRSLKAISGDKTGIYSVPDKKKMAMLAHTKANMQQRVQDREESWTLDTNGSKQGVFEGNRVRKLTPLECERLQGFPDGWTEGLSNTQRYKCCGNAVTVPVIEYIAKEFNSLYWVLCDS